MNCTRPLIATLVLAVAGGGPCARVDGSPHDGDGGFPADHTEQGRPVPGITSSRPHPDVVRGYVVHLLRGGVGPVELVAGPGENGFDAQLYVVQTKACSVVKLDRSGVLTPFIELAALAPGIKPGAGTFDLFGAYDGRFMVCDRAHARLCAMDPGRDVDLVPLDPAEVVPQAIAGDVGGAFGGAVFVASAAGDLFRAEPDGTLVLVAHGAGDVRVLRFTSGPLEDALIALDGAGRRIVRIAPDHEPGTAVETWIDLSPILAAPTHVATGSGGAFPASILYVVDRVSRRIVAINPGGHATTFASNLAPEARVEVPVTGEFAGTMIVASGDQVWLITPDAIDSPSELAEWLDGLGGADLGARDPRDRDLDGDVDANDLLASLRR
jgi:hypothetical protein